MALTANDLVIFVPSISQPIRPLRGTVIAVGANPSVSWEGNAPVTYTAIAAPVGVIRTTVPSALLLSTWLGQKVRLAIPGANGSNTGLVVDVLLIGDPPTAETLVVLSPFNQYIVVAVALATIIAP